ncbi:MAG: sulfatase-like hydrolase/transferase [Elusimicrobiota bacterium]|nr:sulfatase-like hydrolase/transferase [Elusimicrobiota bacterium]
MSIFRAIFFFYYKGAIDLTQLGFDIIKAFYMGMRFDLSIIAKLNMPIALCLIVLLFIGRQEYFNKFLSAAKFYYTIVFGLCLIFLCVDFGFYSYFQNHLNVLVYGLFEDDTKALLSTLNENYNLPLIFLGFIALFAIVFFISQIVLKTNSTRQTKNIGAEIDFHFATIKNFYKKLFYNISLSIAVILITFIFARGTFGTFPLEVDMADVSSNSFLNKVAINGFFTLEAAISARNKESKGIDLIAQTGYDGNIRQAFADYLNKNIQEIPINHPEDSLIVKLPYSKDIDDISPNVVLIVMESFGSYLLDYNSDEFNLLGELKKHFDEDIVFYNFLSGSVGTMVSLESIVTTIPRRPVSMIWSQSQYAYKKYKFGAPLPYKAKGYETFFVYGGGIGWRNSGSFMENLGFDKMIGAGSMNSEYPRNQWGVYDEHLLDFVFNILGQNDKKKFITVLTTSNHPPFSLPSDYKKLPLNTPTSLYNKVLDKELAMKRFEVYQYANDSVGKFISKIKNSKYGGNTIIAVTGDHNFWGLFEFADDEKFISMRVPFYLYIPKNLKARDIDTAVFGDHSDIMATLYNLSLSDIEYMSMGFNMLSTLARQNIAYNDTGLLADKSVLVKYNFQNKNGAYYIWTQNNSRKVLLSEEQAEHRRLIKRFLSQAAIADYLIKNTGE